MRFGINFPIFGEYSNPRLLAELAREAEDLAWDGCFIWDHIQFRQSEPTLDPWITLAAMALATSRVRIGPLVTPLFRRHPWKLARETVTLDHLSQGRLVFGVGLGDDAFGEISTFNGPMDEKVRAAMLDEGLAILTGLWSGAPFSFNGTHFQVRDACFRPPALQSPRIPIWVGGRWPRKPPFRRAARYDGVIPVVGDFRSSIAPAELAQLVAFIGGRRTATSPFDVVQLGSTPAESRDQDYEIVAPYADAGATWWVEGIVPSRRSLGEVRRRIRRGPPSLPLR
jgi:alkanesulfonate monooxygenase SsuD/methylene tetrahydromethanopterin reductase-like flavin-dependent oxidoreductase (luciferase family)